MTDLDFVLITKLQNFGILKKKIKCSKCNEDVERLVKRKRDKNGNEIISWRCKKCQSYKSIRENSFFSLYKTPLQVINQIIKFWCLQLPLIKASELLKLEDLDKFDKKINNVVSSPVIGSVYKNLRSLCSHSILQINIVLGGVGHYVEIDESLVAKVKYNVGHAFGVEQVWLFGLVERGKHGNNK